MKNIIKTLIAGLALVLSMSVFAAKQPDNISGFATEEACTTAASAGKAKGYVPVESRKAGAGYKKTTMGDAGYVNGACVQGLTVFVSSAWVYLPATFAIGQKDESIVMWDCNNPINTISVMPIKQVINRPAPQMSFASGAQMCTASKEECEQQVWCDENKGWVPAIDKDGKSFYKCELPTERRVIAKEKIIQIEEHTTVIPVQLPTTVKPWQVAAPVSVPPAPAAQIDLGRAAAPNVSGTRCDTQGCSYKPVAKFVSEEKADFCGIHTSDARVFKIGRHPTNGELVIADWTSGVQGKVMGLKQQATRDCDADQKAVETTHWPAIVNRFGLPNDCTVAKRLKGKM